MNQFRRLAEARLFRSWWTTLFFTCVMLCGSTASAHTLYIFAAQKGAQVEGKVYFRGGSGAAGAKVEVYDANGNKAQELTCDEEGRFHFQPGFSGKMRLVGILEDGHATEYELDAADFASSGGVSEADTAISPGAATPANTSGNASAQKETRIATESAPPAPEKSGSDPGRLAAAVEQLQAQVVRLREDIQTARSTTGWRDVLGGIGYILGLTGVAFYLSARRNAPRPSATSPAPSRDRTTGTVS
ncbi:hypothetical protein [Thermopirellula anaerolimosa]